MNAVKASLSHSGMRGAEGARLEAAVMLRFTLVDCAVNSDGHDATIRDVTKRVVNGGLYRFHDYVSTRPERRRTTRSQRFASAASCVTRTSVVPRLSWPANMRSTISA